MSKPLCIYHGNCDDGFAAAWVVREVLASAVEFYPGVYQQDPPDVTGRDVIFVDFSYKKPVLEKMAAEANSILILDHHKTAMEDLADYGKPPSFEIWQDVAWDGHLSKAVRVKALFDMERSGASLAWDYLIGTERPDFINYIEDRDLWRKKLPGSDYFTIALRSYMQDFYVWGDLVEAGPGSLIEEGRSIHRYYRLRIEEMKNNAYVAKIADIPCWVANAPYAFASEIAGELAERELSFGATYFEIEKGKYQYSLRSRGDFDVSAIAKKFGGGGHKNAAGFSNLGTVHS